MVPSFLICNLDERFRCLGESMWHAIRDKDAEETAPWGMSAEGAQSSRRATTTADKMELYRLFGTELGRTFWLGGTTALMFHVELLKQMAGMLMFGSFFLLGLSL